MLVERASAMDALDGFLQDAREGNGRLVFVGGEAGVGKTALVRAFVGDAVGVRVLEGACDALATPRPLGPLVDAAAAIGGEVERLLSAEAPQAELFRALLDELAGSRRPVLAVFEDVHWADEATLDLLVFLGRRVGSVPAVALATYRADELEGDHPLRTVLGNLATSDAVRRLPVEPLSPAGVARLAEGTSLDPVALHRLTAGNPFFVTEVLATGEASVPPTVRDAVLARAAALADEPRTLLEAASILDAPASIGLLTDIAGLPARAADAAVEVGLLVASPGGLAFRHELARAAVEGSLPPGRRRDLHARALAALQDQGITSDDLARLAHHAEAAGDVDAVLRFAPDAADRAAALRSHREAAAQYARALRSGRGLPAERAATLREARSYECYLADDLVGAIEERRAALELRRGLEDRRAVAEDLGWLSRLLAFVGDPGGAEEAARGAIGTLDGLPPGRELAWAYSCLGQARAVDDDGQECVTWSARAAALAADVGDVECRVHALNNLGSGLLLDGGPGWEPLEESLRLALDSDLQVHVARAYANLTTFATEHHDALRAIGYVEPGIAYCTARDLDGWTVLLEAHRSEALMMLGRWTEAADQAVGVLARPALHDDIRASAFTTLAAIRVRRGDRDAPEMLDEAAAAAEAAGGAALAVGVLAIRAEAAWLAGDLEAARAHAEEAWDLTRSRPSPWLRGIGMAWIVRAGGDPFDADDLPGPYRAQIVGDSEAAAAAWGVLGCTYEAALARADDGSESALLEALSALDVLGATVAVSAVRRRLRTLGVRMVPRGPRSSTRDDPFGLTAREAEVLALVAEGLEDGEIADRLVLSTRTVEHHVSRILGKLGVRSRKEAGAMYRTRSASEAR